VRKNHRLLNIGILFYLAGSVGTAAGAVGAAFLHANFLHAGTVIITAIHTIKNNNFFIYCSFTKQTTPPIILLMAVFLVSVNKVIILQNVIHQQY